VTADRSHVAWRTADLSQTCRLPFGRFSVEEAAGLNLLDVLAHTWDMASPLGIELDDDDAVWRDGLAAAHHLIVLDRDPRHYGPAKRAMGASPMMDFLGFLGR
jgi:hypothetical protein